MSLPAGQDPGLRGTFSFRLAVPHTVPPLGIVKVWQCSQPIQTAPDIRGVLDQCDLIPKRLLIQNVDRPRQLEAMEGIYREKNDLEGLEAYLKQALRFVRTMENDKRTLTGYTLLMQYSHRQPGHIPGSMQVAKRLAHIGPWVEPTVSRTMHSRGRCESMASPKRQPVNGFGTGSSGLGNVTKRAN